MSIPVANDVYTYLEGYCIDATELGETWINDRINKRIIPRLESTLGFSLTSETEKTVYVSGTGFDTLVLPDKKAKELVSIDYIQDIEDVDYYIDVTAYEIVDGGILKAIGRHFTKGRKNIKITYKIGYADDTNFPTDLEELMLLQSVIVVLVHLANRTGGGQLSIQSYSRNHGERGMYTHLINQLNTECNSIIKKYKSGVVQI